MLISLSLTSLNIQGLAVDEPIFKLNVGYTMRVQNLSYINSITRFILNKYK
jgi:hypothetical protein